MTSYDQYQQLLGQVFGLRRFGKERTLAPLKQLFRELGHPEEGLRFVHVVGTNGKGSTASLLSTILGASGRKVGLFTSPHLVDFEERFRVDQVPLPWNRVHSQLKRVLEAQARQKNPGLFFDVTTATAIALFAEEGVDVVVLEAGLGGAKDATAALPSSLVVMTNVGRDHVSVLGGTLASVTQEKAGAAQPAVPFVMGAMNDELGVLARNMARAQGAAFVWEEGREWSGEVKARAGTEELQLTTPVHRWTALPLCCDGPFHRKNAPLAAAAASALAAQGWDLKEASVRRGLARADWFGRWQTGLWRGRRILVDGAHNVAAVEVMLEALRGQRVHLLFGSMQGKEPELSFRAMQGKLCSLTLFSLPQPRAASQHELRSVAERHCPEIPLATHPTLRDALDAVCPKVPEGETIVVCGSLFVWEVLLRCGEFALEESLTFGER